MLVPRLGLVAKPEPTPPHFSRPSQVGIKAVIAVKAVKAVKALKAVKAVGSTSVSQP